MRLHREKCWGLVAGTALLWVFGCHGTRGSQSSQSTETAQPAATPSIGVVRQNSVIDELLDPNVKITRVATGFGFTEGPMWREGRLWFSDLPGNKMYAVSPDGTTQVLIDHSGGLDHPTPGLFLGSNAMVTDKDGSVLMLQHGMRRIVHVDDRLHITPFLERYQGKRFNSPNDLVFANDGSLWFTDPPFGLPGKEHDPGRELDFSGVYVYANGQLKLATRDLSLPNGIAFSPDGKTLYVSNSGPEMYVVEYSVGSDHQLSHPRKLISYPSDPKADVPDGMKVDSTGNIWTTGPDGIRIITPAGKVLGQIKLPRTSSNLAWADSGKTLYITDTDSIYRLPVKVPGVMPLYSK